MYGRIPISHLPNKIIFYIRIKVGGYEDRYTERILDYINTLQKLVEVIEQLDDLGIKSIYLYEGDRPNPGKRLVNQLFGLDGYWVINYSEIIVETTTREIADREVE